MVNCLAGNYSQYCKGYNFRKYILEIIAQFWNLFAILDQTIRFSAPKSASSNNHFVETTESAVELEHTDPNTKNPVPQEQHGALQIDQARS